MTGPWALVPVKDPRRAKRRLAGALDPAARRALVQAMLEDLLAALAATPGLAGVALVCAEPATAARAKALLPGLRLLPDSGGGPNAALAAAARTLAAEGARALLVVAADLPCVRARELETVTAALGAGPGAVVVPDRHGRGSNALAWAPPAALAPAFGPDSLARHLARAARAGLPAETLALPGLALDLDTPADVAWFLASGGATRSHRVLAAVPGLAERLARAPGAPQLAAVRP